MGGRFCSLDQLSTSLVEMMYFRRQNWMKTKKRKRSSQQFATIFGRKFVGYFSPGWLFFLWSSSDQLLMGGRLNLDGATLISMGRRVLPRPPLQFKYWLCLVNMQCIYANVLQPFFLRGITFVILQEFCIPLKWQCVYAVCRYAVCGCKLA